MGVHGGKANINTADPGLGVPGGNRVTWDRPLPDNCLDKFEVLKHLNSLKTDCMLLKQRYCPYVKGTCKPLENRHKSID